MIDHFSLFAPVYDRLIGPPSVRRLERLLDLARNHRLLDVGGGTGRVSSRLGLSKGGMVIADISQGMLKEAARRSLPVVAARSERLPFADGRFDRALVVDSLHHFQDQPTAVAEMARVLAPGGRLVIEEPDIRRFIIKGVALAEKLFLMGSFFNTPETICRFMADAGLRAIISETDPLRAWITGEKPKK